MRVADFFCGGGGFSEGFRQAGFDLCFAVDKWEPAVKTYLANKPLCSVIQDDVVRLSTLPDEEFDKIIPDTEVIIGSPPCVAFSNSNKSGSGDKTLGIKLLESYLRIIARKKFKRNSILRYWVLENVPNIKKHIKDEYQAKDLELEGDFILRPLQNASIYNAKYFGAPTNRKRFLCGEFPQIEATHTDKTAITLGQVLKSLHLSGNPKQIIQDCNYSSFSLPATQVTDNAYLCELQPYEWKTSKRLKEDKGYMGKMSFPENLSVPARTVMATMTAISRESMIISHGDGRYRLPTVRETASMMSFPIDYRFYGESKGIKHTLIGNAVPPKLSYAIAKSIAIEAGQPIPENYIPIQHNLDIPFVNLNGLVFPRRNEQEKRIVSKFKYHIPYTIINAFRVELTNYHSDFVQQAFRWDVEIHHGQGKKRAKMFHPDINVEHLSQEMQRGIEAFIDNIVGLPATFLGFQRAFCMTEQQRLVQGIIGPYELLELTRNFIRDHLREDEQREIIDIGWGRFNMPQAILAGAFTLKRVIQQMEGH